MIDKNKGFIYFFFISYRGQPYRDKQGNTKKK